MRTRHPAVVTAILTAILTACLAVLAPVAASAAPATGIIGKETGTGPTLADAVQAGSDQMYSDYYGCKTPFWVVSSGQYASGVWWAKVDANCLGYV